MSRLRSKAPVPILLQNVETGDGRLSLIHPIQSEVVELFVYLGQIPQLQAPGVHADCEVTSIRTEGERQHSFRQQQPRLDRARVVKARLTTVMRDPEHPEVRRVEDANEIRQHARAFPGRRAPHGRQRRRII